MSINFLNLTELTKRYKQYSTYLVSLELDLLKFKNKHDIMEVKMKITEETSFNTIRVSCKTDELVNKFKLCSDDFKRNFNLKLIEENQLKRHYDDKQETIYNYIYTDIDNNQFNEINMGGFS